MPSLGCCEEFIVEHVRPHILVVAPRPQAAVPVGELRHLVDDVTESAALRCVGRLIRGRAYGR